MTLSCLAPVEAGMVVRTESPEIDKVRRVAAELLIVNHHADCLACTKNNRCDLQRIAAYVGIDAERLARLRRPEKTLPVDAPIRSSTTIPTSACCAASACGLATRSWGSMRWTSPSAGSTRWSAPSATSRSSSRGASRAASAWCAARSGSLVPKESQQPSREVKTVCPYCGVGCGIYLGVRGNRIVGVRGDRQSPVNHGRLCVKGRFGHDFVHHPDRLTTPLITEERRTGARHVGRGAGPGRPTTGAVPRRGLRRHGLGQVHQRGELPAAEVRPAGDGHQQHRPLRPALPFADGGRAGADRWAAAR